MKESAEEEAVEGREMEEEEDDEDDEDDDDEDEDEQASAGGSQPARDTTSAFEDRENMLRTALVVRRPADTRACRCSASPCTARALRRCRPPLLLC